MGCLDITTSCPRSSLDPTKLRDASLAHKQSDTHLVECLTVSDPLGAILDVTVHSQIW